MITRPLDLESRLSRPPRDFDVMFWIAALAVVLFFDLLGSRFVLPPGMAVGLAGGDQAIELPEFAGGVNTGGPAPVVISVRRDTIILFEGGMYTSLQDVRQPMRTYARLHPGSSLLIRADRQVSQQAVMDLCSIAAAAGFRRAVIAGRPASRDAGPDSGTGTR